MKGAWLCLIVSLFCGSVKSYALTTEEIANLTGPDRQKILEDGARKEGELLWIGGFNDENARPIIKGFTARYPFIKVNRVRTDGNPGATARLGRITGACTPHTDLITADSVVDLEKANAVQPFKSPALDSLVGCKIAIRPASRRRSISIITASRPSTRIS